MLMSEKILVVDDEESIRKVLSVSLRDKGYEVLTAENGAGGLKVFSEAKPAIVLVDIRMPGMDGIDLLQKIKGQSPDTEVIMISGHGDMELAISSLQLEAADFITKPIDDADLDVALKRTRERISLKSRVREYTENLERLVREKTENINVLMSTVPAIFFQGYKDWYVDFFSDKVEELTGYQLDDFNSRRVRWSDLVLPEDIHILKESLRAAWKADRPYVREYRICSKNEQVLWIQERSRLVLDRDGDIKAIMGFLFDVTERRMLQLELEHANEELKRLNVNLEQEVQQRTQQFIESEKRFRTLFEQTKDLILMVDSNWRLTSINPSALSLLGYGGKDEVSSMPLSNLFQSAGDFNDYRERLLLNKSIKDWETQIARKDGSSFPVVITADLLQSERGEVLGASLIAKDLTDWRRIINDTMELQKMASMGQISAGVAHELNTPLGVILAHAQLLQDDFSPHSETHESLKIIEGQTHICRRIVWDLLEFSHPEVSKEVAVSVEDLLQEVLRVMDHTLELDHIQIIGQYADLLPPVMADKEKLRRVYVNILNNAHQAIGSDGIILIRTYFDEAEGSVCISFADSGPGIPSDIHERVFEPFFTSKEVSEGTGLGLSLAHGIIRDHGGNIEIESPISDEHRALMCEQISTGIEGLIPLGPGTSFTVRLPTLGAANERLGGT
jgi:PAS domain S-box-containing protein